MSGCSSGCADLDRFYLNLIEIIDGRYPDLSPNEYFWLRVFKEVAGRYDKVPKSESYWLSFDALYECDRKGKAANQRYLWAACRNKHLDFLRRRKRTRPLRPSDDRAVDDRDLADFRFDLRESLPKLQAQNPLHEQVIRMLWAGHTHMEIAVELRVTEKKAQRIVKAALESLRQLMEVDEKCS